MSETNGWFDPESMNQSGMVYMPRGYETVGPVGMEDARRFRSVEHVKSNGYTVRDRGEGRTRTPRFVAKRVGY